VTPVCAPPRTHYASQALKHPATQPTPSVVTARSTASTRGRLSDVEQVSPLDVPHSQTIHLHPLASTAETSRPTRSNTRSLDQSDVSRRWIRDDLGIAQSCASPEEHQPAAQASVSRRTKPRTTRQYPTHTYPGGRESFATSAARASFPTGREARSREPTPLTPTLPHSRTRGTLKSRAIGLDARDPLWCQHAHSRRSADSNSSVATRGSAGRHRARTLAFSSLGGSESAHRVASRTGAGSAGRSGARCICWRRGSG
jgi:hypothetical protein